MVHSAGTSSAGSSPKIALLQMGKSVAAGVSLKPVNIVPPRAVSKSTGGSPVLSPVRAGTASGATAAKAGAATEDMKHLSGRYGSPLVPVRRPTPPQQLETSATACLGNNVSVTVKQGNSSTEQVIVDHQGNATLVVQPDGNVVCKVPDSKPAGNNSSGQASGGCELTDAEVVVGVAMMVTAVVSFMGVLVGMSAGSDEMYNARNKNYCLSKHELTRVVADATSSIIAGTLTGVVVGPIMAVRTLLVSGARPLLLLGAAASVLGFVRNRRSGPEALLRQLQNGTLQQQLEALHRMAARASESGRFRRNFDRVGGVELLVSLLRQTGDDCYVQLASRTLLELQVEPSCKEALVNSGGVGVVAPLLEHSNTAIVNNALRTLHALMDHSLAKENVRAVGAIPALVSLLRHTLIAAWQELLVQIVMHLSIDPVSNVELCRAGAVEPLVDMLAKQPGLRDQKREDAVLALHSLVRGSAEGQRALQAVPHSQDVLTQVLGAWGQQWYRSKPDLYAVLNIVARSQYEARRGAAAGGGEAVAASSKSGPHTEADYQWI